MAIRSAVVTTPDPHACHISGSGPIDHRIELRIEDDGCIGSPEECRKFRLWANVPVSRRPARGERTDEGLALDGRTARPTSVPMVAPGRRSWMPTATPPPRHGKRRVDRAPGPTSARAASLSADSSMAIRAEAISQRPRAVIRMMARSALDSIADRAYPRARVSTIFGARREQDGREPPRLPSSSRHAPEASAPRSLSTRLVSNEEFPPLPQTAAQQTGGASDPRRRPDGWRRGSASAAGTS